MAKILETPDLKKLIESNTDQNAELNAALIAAAALWGVKSSELSLIETGDILTGKGELKRTWALKKGISANGYARELYTEHVSLVMYMEAYLNWRVSHKIGVSNIGEYRNLDPESRLFLSDKGEAFKFARRSADNKADLQPTGMNNYFKKLINNSGITGLTYKDFRRSLAIQMFREGCGNKKVKKTIMEYLGIRSYDALMKILNANPKTLNEMVKGIYNRI
ncbi:MAG: hypothetical protein QM500_12115 [Methylococcales bacterium]